MGSIPTAIAVNSRIIENPFVIAACHFQNITADNFIVSDHHGTLHTEIIAWEEKRMEDKQQICSLFLKALQKTRNLDDLEDLKYDPEKQIVTAVFPAGKKKVNVAGDSGTAMMMDILHGII